MEDNDTSFVVTLEDNGGLEWHGDVAEQFRESLVHSDGLAHVRDNRDGEDVTEVEGARFLETLLNGRSWMPYLFPVPIDEGGDAASPPWTPVAGGGRPPEVSQGPPGVTGGQGRPPQGSTIGGTGGATGASRGSGQEPKPPAEPSGPRTIQG